MSFTNRAAETVPVFLSIESDDSSLFDEDSLLKFSLQNAEGTTILQPQSASALSQQTPRIAVVDPGVTYSVRGVVELDASAGNEYAGVNGTMNVRFVAYGTNGENRGEGSVLPVNTGGGPGSVQGTVNAPGAASNTGGSASVAASSLAHTGAETAGGTRVAFAAIMLLMIGGAVVLSRRRTTPPDTPQLFAIPASQEMLP